MVTTTLKASGIRHLRDSGPLTKGFIATYADLGVSGVNHSLGMVANFTEEALRANLDAFAPYIDYVEPANEQDNVANPNYAQIKADQMRLWTVVKSNPAYAKVAVVGPSFANPVNSAKVGPLDAYEDYAQLHNGTCDWNPGTAIKYVSIPVATAAIRLGTAYKPIITTETGYSDNLTRACGLSDQNIAKYLPRTSAERWLAGQSRSYFDFLTDKPSDLVWGALGLLHADGSPKPQFLTESNLIKLLADEGTAPAPQTIAYSISGATVDLHHLMLSRRDGTFDLLLWRELPLWDHYGHVAIVVPPLPVQLGLPAGKANASLFAYNNSYGFTRTQLAVSNHVTAIFNVTDSISVIHIRR